MIKKTYSTVIFLILIVVLLTQSGCNFSTLNSTTFKKATREYCQNNSEIQFKDILLIDWNAAYIDFNPHERGEAIKEKYGLTCDLEELDSDGEYRILFFKDDTLVFEARLDFDYDFSFDGDYDIFYPETVFLVGTSEEKVEEKGSYHLYMKP